MRLPSPTAAAGGAAVTGSVTTLFTAAALLFTAAVCARELRAAGLRAPAALSHDGLTVALVALTAALALVSLQRRADRRRDRAMRRAAERSLQASEQRFRSLVQQISDIITVFGPDGTIQYLSPSVEPVLGYPPGEVLPADPWFLIHPGDVAHIRRLLDRIVETPGSHPPVEMRMRHRDGSWRYLEAAATNLLDDPSVRGIVVISRDITERKQLEAQLTHQAFYDPLTGLANRALFMDQLARALAALDRRGQHLAVLFLDLDGFKVVNDRLGHAAGDALLAVVGRRLAECLRPGDTVARFGGDEFAVLLSGLPSPTRAVEAARRILAELRRPVTLDGGREVFVAASVGIVLDGAESPRPRPDELLRKADIALYQAKAAGKGQAVIFDAAMNARAVERLDLETDLRRAVERGELVLHYQPEVDLASGAIVGMEALVRWQHPRRGLIAPGEFIPLAEETGLIVPIGQWVLDEACRQARAWQAETGGAVPLVLSANLSARQVAQPDLVQRVARTLRETGLDPRGLKLEVTESAIMHDADAAARTLHALRGLGVGLAIDDFGTGYSSLSYLRRFPFDTLKVDRSFVNGLDREQGAVAIVQAVSGLAHALGMTVTVEGIETRAQLASAWSVHCTHGQGYYFSPPVPGAALGRLLGGGLSGAARAPLARAQGSGF